MSIPARLFLPLIASLLAAPVSLLAQEGRYNVETGGGFSPQEALRRMVVPPDLEVQLVGSEPQVEQPLAIRFDHQGRMWVLEFLQYPNPAGLKPVSVDIYLRTVYDKVPEPPPKGPKGADRVLIFGQQDATGHRPLVKEFVGGLNIASGIALGYDGLFVIQPPYLLYYPDKNRDDVPDGPPEVLLSGFGLQDTHAVANSLHFGPDGWLYGAQGSTTTSNVNGYEFNQGIWRYNVQTHVFELFAEGGGNTWSLDFDQHGNVIAGTNYEKVALHQVQGAYYIKNFGKHGALHNPYAFGYFDHIPIKIFKGGHLSTGGIVYQGGALPERFNNTYICGNLIANSVYWYDFKRDGSSFTMELGDGNADFLVSHDPLFRAVDLETGPDGAIYIADWYDKRLNHVDPREHVDKSNGRVYKMQAKGAKPLPPFDLNKKSGAELVALLGSSNKWYAETARQMMAERHDPADYPALRKNITDNPGKLALESLWALYVSKGFDESVALQAMEHPNEDVRTWSVRLLGDSHEATSAEAERMASLAQKDPSPQVRNQLAATAKRLPGTAALPIIRALLHRDEDINDPMIPMLVWWAVESKATSDRDGVLSLLESPSDWKAPITHQYIIPRLGRRYAAEANDANFQTCTRLLAMAPGPAEVNLLIQGMAEAFEGGQPLANVPPQLREALDKLWAQGHPSSQLVRFAAQLGNKNALADARSLILDPSVSVDDRIATITLLGQIGGPESKGPLLKLLDVSQPEKIQAAALAALQSYSDPEIAVQVLAIYPRLNTRSRLRARTFLEARAATALLLLQAVDENRIPQKEIPLAEVQKISQFPGAEISGLIFKRWGKVRSEGKVENLVLIHGVENDLRRGVGNPAAGRNVFLTLCSACHALFGEGGHIGPDLMTVDRRDTTWLVENILFPSLVIRPEFVGYNAQLKDGRALSGFISDANEKTVTLRDVTDQRTVVDRSQIKSLDESPVSLMPPGLLESMSLQQIRDLFAYLQK